MFFKNLLFALVIGLFVTSCSKETTGVNPAISDSTYNVDVLSDIQYGQNTTYTGSSENLMMDIYMPKNATGNKYPVVVMAHGGSFLVGDKQNIAPLCSAIAARGYIAVSLNYRLGWDFGNVKSPADCEGDTTSLQKAIYRVIQDYNAAARYLVHNADQFHIDKNWLFIGGSSAGAVSAIGTNYITPDFVNNSYLSPIGQQLGALNNAGNNLTDAFTIKGIVSLWGGIMAPQLITKESAVPMVAFHGNMDHTIPFDYEHYALCPNYPILYGSHYIFNTLRTIGVPIVLHIAEAEGHEPPMYQDPVFMSDNIDCFLQSVMNNTVKTATYQNLTQACQ